MVKTLYFTVVPPLHRFSNSTFTITTSLSNRPICLLYQIPVSTLTAPVCLSLPTTSLLRIFFVQQVLIFLDVPKMLGERQHRSYTLPQLTNTFHTAKELTTQPLCQFIINLGLTQPQILMNILPAFNSKQAAPPPS